MKIKIVCWGTEDNILCSAIEKGLGYIGNDEIKRGYYLLEGNRAEIVIIKENSDFLYNECLKTNNDTLLVVFTNYVDDYNVRIIKQIIKERKSIIIAQEDRLSTLEEDKQILERINYINFTNEKYVEIKGLIYLILDNYHKEIEENNLCGNTILSGLEENSSSLQNLTIDIIKNATYIKDKKNLLLNIHCNRHLETEEKISIEDALKDYLDDITVLIIKQYNINIIEDKLYFNLISIK